MTPLGLFVADPPPEKNGAPSSGMQYVTGTLQATWARTGRTGAKGAPLWALRGQLTAPVDHVYLFAACVFMQNSNF